MTWKNGGEVEERARHGGDRYGTQRRPLVLRQPQLVHPHALQRPPGAVERQLEHVGGPQSPERRGRAVAQDRAGTGRERGRDPNSISREDPVTDRVHTPVHGM
jgi:hypothetical protein